MSPIPFRATLAVLILANSFLVVSGCGRTIIEYEKADTEAPAKPRVTFKTKVGKSYDISASTNLAEWVPVASISGTGRDESWTDPALDISGNRFYRVDPIQTPKGNLASGSLTVIQSWSQETNYVRDALVGMPENPDNPGGPHPVVITLHGGGGSPNLNAYGYLNDRYIKVAPRGYMNQWNAGRENSKAPDVEFIREIILQLREYDNVDAGDISIIGSSNGSALLNQLLIELNGALFQQALSFVSPLNKTQYHDSQYWGDPEITSNFDTALVPAAGRRILAMSGTADSIIPYNGGSGILGYQFIAAQESVYLQAKVMGETGPQLSDEAGILVPNRDSPSDPAVIYEYSYLDGDVIHYKVVGEGHNLGGIQTGATRREIILRFLAGN
jgi:poly(3-hydroxybutyrate) depolymerase